MILKCEKCGDVIEVDEYIGDHVRVEPDEEGEPIQVQCGPMVEVTACPDCENGIKTIKIMRAPNGKLDYLHGKLTGETYQEECLRCEGTGYLE